MNKKLFQFKRNQVEVRFLWCNARFYIIKALKSVIVAKSNRPQCHTVFV